MDVRKNNKKLLLVPRNTRNIPGVRLLTTETQSSQGKEPLFRVLRASVIHRNLSETTPFFFRVFCVFRG